MPEPPGAKTCKLNLQASLAKAVLCRVAEFVAGYGQEILRRVADDGPAAIGIGNGFHEWSEEALFCWGHNVLPDVN